MTEREARNSPVCYGCGAAKSFGETGCVVCWTCFKYRADITPLKYFNGTFEQWVSTLPVKSPNGSNPNAGVVQAYPKGRWV